jgi:AraC-like DNA-binding protein
MNVAVDTTDGIAFGVRPEWMFSLVSACQRLAGETFDADRDEFTRAVTRFQLALPLPERPLELMVLRDKVIENATKAAELFDWCFHRRFSSAPCEKLSIQNSAEIWRGPSEDVRELLSKWQHLFLTRFAQDHSWPIADRIAAILRERSADRVAIDDLARELGCARTRITREFRVTFGISVAVYHTRARLHHALRALREPTYSVDAVARMIGYRSPKNFYAALQSITPLSPSAVRRLSDHDFYRLLDSMLPDRSLQEPYRH